MNIADATVATRIHHQWRPDYIRVESGLSSDTRFLLEAQGYQLKVQRAMGGTNSIMRENSQLSGYSDPRKPGSLTMGL